MKKLAIFVLPFVAFFATAAITNWDGVLPNANLTPGAVNTNLQISAIAQHGFVSGTDARHVTESEKKAVFMEYFGKVPANRGDYEIDHLISLELGGANDIHNLWPQSYTAKPWNAHVKDKLENWMSKSVRDSYKTNATYAEHLLQVYQYQISHNWTNAYLNYLGQPK